ncbi:NTP transferase domain-containing protein [Pantoea sp. GM01]|uniref:nucleotidyltransferase family protein n=1 Tax=Pantoea sp. GM01 TaxID=1144320 RepID=UPI000270F09C|nr:nucleotidyltransferase family protein [Pantoea sp. GM01]EJL93173.1 putative MobA-like protein [Pantoea sp. GM01]
MQNAILILAAGHSRRFRQVNGQHKLLTMINDKPVLQHTLEQASATGMDVYVVTRPEDRHIHSLLKNATPIFCHSDGIGSSIAAGMKACEGYHGVIISLADLPWLKTSSYLAVSSALQNNASVRAMVNEKPGHPVGFQCHYFQALALLQGDTGAQTLLRTCLPEPVYLDDIGCLRDIDRPDDLLGTERS